MQQSVHLWIYPQTGVFQLLSPTMMYILNVFHIQSKIHVQCVGNADTTSTSTHNLYKRLHALIGQWVSPDTSHH